MGNCHDTLPPSVGTVLKLAVKANLGGVHMSEVDFNCVFFRKGCQKTVKLTKQDMTYVGDDEYIATVPTSVIGPGEYLCRFSADIPDGDVPDGMRPETVVIPTGVRVVE